VFAAAGAALAAALRVWTLASPIGGLDADEAVWGLMTRHALEGELAVFFWGQAYGGTHEVLLSIPVFALAGSSAAAVRVVPLALFAVASLLVWRVGRRTIGEPAATAAAVFFAIWPPYLVWKSTRAHGFYGSMLVLSLLVLLFTLRLGERPSRRDAAALGVCLGLGWWAGPATAVIALPAVLWLAVRLRADALRIWPALPAAVVGALPWLIWNLSHDFASLDASFESGGTYTDHVRTFFWATFPTMLSLRTPFTLEWITVEALTRAVTVAAFLLLVSMLLRDPPRRLLGAVALTYPVLQSLSPFATLNEEPRYLVLLAPVLALGIADVAARTLSRATLAAILLAGLSVFGIHELNRQEPPVPPVGGVRVPADVGPALQTLERLGERRVRAHYAIAYRITFESRERIVAASTGQSRRPAYELLVSREERPAFVFVRDSAEERRFRRAGYYRVVAGDWAVYVGADPP
jgi:4-amino-4-deoxy-L-arabinose transferase-like glycosyltransferase